MNDTSSDEDGVSVGRGGGTDAGAEAEAEAGNGGHISFRSRDRNYEIIRTKLNAFESFVLLNAADLLARPSNTFQVSMCA